jgi:PAS domain S-box-containing protein
MKIPPLTPIEQDTERLHFEALLADISSKYINLPVDRIDAEIEDDQRRICECFNIDLSSLWQWEDESHRFLILTHLYSPPGGPERPERIEAGASFPWLLQQMELGKTLSLATTEMVPETVVDQKTRLFYGVKSSVVIPLSVGGGSLIGVLSFDTLWVERHWSEEIIKRLIPVAQIFSNALARKTTEKSLRASEARLRLAADSAGAGLWEFNAETGLFWATQHALEIFGHTSRSEPLSMKRVEQLIHPEDMKRVHLVVNQAFENGRPLDIEYRVLADDGSLKWVHSRGEPYFKADGTPNLLLGISIDITARKLVELKLKISEERLASAFDIAELGFYETVEEYNLQFVDNRMRGLLGVSRGQKEKRRFWLEHIHEDDADYVHSVIGRVLTGGVNRFNLQYRYRHPKRGTLWLHHLSRVLERDAGGLATRVIGVMQDITERKQAEFSLIESKKTLKNHQKDLQRLAGRLIAVQEEEMRRLARELHDDLTQRLAALAIECGKLELQQDRPPDDRKALTRIKEQLIAVSQDVHSMSRQLHPTIISDLGLISAIKEEVAMITRREGIEIVFEHTQLPEDISEDISLCLYRIIQEGLKNVVSHSGSERCELVLHTDERGCRLTIGDNGVGFDHSKVKHKPGLGLSSMRERVLLVNGTFQIDSRPGKGTAVHVAIPFQENSS